MTKSGDSKFNLDLYRAWLNLQGDRTIHSNGMIIMVKSSVKIEEEGVNEHK